MIRVLITGMSGTGKSTVIAVLAARGYRAIDTDYDDWHIWVEVDGEFDWVWREDRMCELLSSDAPGFLFVSGTSVNQGKFYPLFDHVILLSAPTPLIVERLASRANNPYGKSPEELARVLEHIETDEPLLRHGATAEIRTDAPIQQVVQQILDLVVEAEGTE
ncbi:MAG: AAA family ATPase [Nitrolancea sp.]